MSPKTSRKYKPPKPKQYKNSIANHKSLDFTVLRIPEYIAMQDTRSLYPAVPYYDVIYPGNHKTRKQKFIQQHMPLLQQQELYSTVGTRPTKAQRKQIKKAWKIIQDGLDSKEAVSLMCSLKNNEVPYELTLEQVQSLNGVDFFTEEYIELLYEAFDKYEPDAKVFAERQKQRDINKAKAKGRTSWYVKWLEFKEKHEQYKQRRARWREIQNSPEYIANRDKWRLIKKRLYLLHTLRRIMTVKSGVDYTVPHYHILKPSDIEALKQADIELEKEIKLEEQIKALQDSINSFSLSSVDNNNLNNVDNNNTIEEDN